MRFMGILVFFRLQVLSEVLALRFIERGSSRAGRLLVPDGPTPP